MRIMSKNQLIEDLKNPRFETIFPEKLTVLQKIRESSCGCTTNSLVSYVLEHKDKLQQFYNEPIFVIQGNANKTQTATVVAEIDAVDQAVRDFKMRSPVHGYFDDFKITPFSETHVLITFLFGRVPLPSESKTGAIRLFLTTNCQDCLLLKATLNFDPDTTTIEGLHTIILSGTSVANLDVVAHYGVADLDRVEFPCMLDFNSMLLVGKDVCYERLCQIGLVGEERSWVK